MRPARTIGPSLVCIAVLLALPVVLSCAGDSGSTPGITEPPPEPAPPEPSPVPGPGTDIFDFPLRSIQLTGNWGTNQEAADQWEADGGRGSLIHEDYWEWIDSLHVNWVGVAVHLHYEDSMDSTIERDYSPQTDTPTFSDRALRQIIRELRDHGLDVLVTLAFDEVAGETAERPLGRWQLGDPASRPGGVPHGDRAHRSPMLPENWPWRPDHPDHERFVAEFWATYTEQAVHFAEIAEDEGVGLFQLGTETDRLFRTRPSDGPMTNDFGDELRSMVARVRSVYSGRLTYDTHWSAIVDPDFHGPGSGAGHLWEDLGLDVVGVSAYFPLTEDPPSQVLDLRLLETSYERIFHDHLIPLAGRNPGRPVVFLEYGVKDLVAAVHRPSLPGFPPFVFADSNGNGLDDGRETQANMFQAFFNTMERYPGVVNGAFLWGNWIASDKKWAEHWAGRRNFSIRDKPAEAVVRSVYTRFLNPER